MLAMYKNQNVVGTLLQGYGVQRVAYKSQRPLAEEKPGYPLTQSQGSPSYVCAQRCAACSVKWRNVRKNNLE